MKADLRQGGGSTFGVIISVTVKTFPSTQFATTSAFVGTLAGSEKFWEVVASILGQYTNINAQDISGYLFITPNITIAATGQSILGLPNNTLIDICYGILTLPLLHPSNTSDSLNAALDSIFKSATALLPKTIYLLRRPAKTLSRLLYLVCRR